MDAIYQKNHLEQQRKKKRKQDEDTQKRETISNGGVEHLTLFSKFFTHTHTFSNTKFIWKYAHAIHLNPLHVLCAFHVWLSLHIRTHIYYVFQCILCHMLNMPWILCLKRKKNTVPFKRNLRGNKISILQCRKGIFSLLVDFMHKTFYSKSNRKTESIWAQQCSSYSITFRFHDLLFCSYFAIHISIQSFHI